MPLIILSGLPLSGKSTIAHTIQSILKKNNVKEDCIHCINDESLRITKSSAYADPQEEKKARAALLSAVERYLTKENIVICDGLNYIKGFRYQLYCIARSLMTPSCVVYAACPTQICETRFLEQLEMNSDTYPESQFLNICSRYEEPDDRRNRWDSPLLLVGPDDDFSELYEQKLLQILFNQTEKRPNQSTISKPLSEANYVTEWDSIVQEGLNHILNAQKHGFSGGKLKWDKSNHEFTLPSRTIPLTELRRLKRQYLSVSRMHNQLTLSQIAESFVDFLNLKLNE